MKVLVTGATGFLGQKLALRLNTLGFAVTGTGRNVTIGNSLQANGIEFVRCDLADTAQMVDLCRGKEYVFHCGALSSPWGKYYDFFEANVLGTQNIITGCKKHNVKRMIHVSTPSIYFDFTDRLNISETEPLPAKPVNHYAATKLLAEKEIDLAHSQGLPVISIRPRAIFGPGDTAIIPRLIKANAKFGVPSFADCNPLVDITYVENVVDALLLCKDSDASTLGRKYNITNGEPIYLNELLKTLFQKLGQPLKLRKTTFRRAYTLASLMEFTAKTFFARKEPPLTRYSVGVLTKCQTLDISAACKELGYQPRISIDQGVNIFVDWWKENEIDK